MTKKDQSILSVVSRDVLGKKVQNIRKNGMIPANITGLSEASESVTLNAREFTKHVENEGESGLLYLASETSQKKTPVLIEEIQYAPVSGAVLHVAFRRVNLLVKVTADVPLETIGEFALKEANVVIVTDTLEVEALPADLPESFVLDVSRLTEIGQSLTIADLEYDREKITILMSEEEKENPLVMAQEQREEEVVEVVEPEAAPTEAPAATEATGDQPE